MWWLSHRVVALCSREATRCLRLTEVMSSSNFTPLFQPCNRLRSLVVFALNFRSDASHWSSEYAKLGSLFTCGLGKG